MSVVSELKQSPERTKAGARHPPCYRALAPAAETTLVSGSKSARVRAVGKGRDGGSQETSGRKVGKGERRSGEREKKKGRKLRNNGGKVHVGEVNSSGGFAVPAAPVSPAAAGTSSLPPSAPLGFVVVMFIVIPRVCLFICILLFDYYMQRFPV